MLVLVSGLPGTGKTTVANQIAKDIDGVVLRTDAIRREIFKEASIEEIERSDDPYKYDLQGAFNKLKIIPEKYQRLIWRQNEKVYDVLFKRLQDYLKDKNVIIDATFYKRDLRDRAYDIAEELNKEVILVLTECPEECVKSRIVKRKTTPDEYSHLDKIEVYDKIKNLFEDPKLDGKPIFIYNTESQEIEENNTTEEMEIIRTSLEKLRLRYK